MSMNVADEGVDLTSENPEVVEMVRWFLDNYKDPADGVPFDSGEGGYQFVNGGPYQATEELEAVFPRVSQKHISRAVELIEAEGWEWVKVDEY